MNIMEVSSTELITAWNSLTRQTVPNIRNAQIRLISHHVLVRRENYNTVYFQIDNLLFLGFWAAESASVSAFRLLVS